MQIILSVFDRVVADEGKTPVIYAHSILVSHEYEPFCKAFFSIHFFQVMHRNGDSL